MSDAVRMHLDWKDNSEKSMPKSLFYKRVDMQSLAHVRLKKTTAPMKIGRDVRSFYVESAFLSFNERELCTPPASACLDATPRHFNSTKIPPWTRNLRYV